MTLDEVVEVDRALRCPGVRAVLRHLCADPPSPVEQTLLMLADWFERSEPTLGGPPPRA